MCVSIYIHTHTRESKLINRNQRLKISLWSVVRIVLLSPSWRWNVDLGCPPQRSLRRFGPSVLLSPCHEAAGTQSGHKSALRCSAFHPLSLLHHSTDVHRLSGTHTHTHTGGQAGRKHGPQLSRSALRSARNHVPPPNPNSVALLHIKATDLAHASFSISYECFLKASMPSFVATLGCWK